MRYLLSLATGRWSNNGWAGAPRPPLPRQAGDTTDRGSGEGYARGEPWGRDRNAVEPAPTDRASARLPAQTRRPEHLARAARPRRSRGSVLARWQLPPDLATGDS